MNSPFPISPITFSPPNLPRQHQQWSLLLESCNCRRFRKRTIYLCVSRRCLIFMENDSNGSLSKWSQLGKTYQNIPMWPFQSAYYGAYHKLFAMSREQSLDSRRKWEETPDYPEAVQALCWTYVASCLVERAWRFALPALLASISENLVPVALNSFISQLAVFIGGPFVGAFMDSKPRVFSFTLLSLMQTVSILISATMVLYAINRGLILGLSVFSLALQPWFLLLVFASAVDRITGLATGVAFERDWVVLLAGQARTVALARANAMLRRVDLVCDIIGPFLFGLALSKYNPVTCVLTTCATAIVSFPILAVLVMKTYNFSYGVLDRPKQSNQESRTSSLGVKTFAEGWSQYLMQPILPASIAYVLLSFNAILAPSGLMTTFLTQRGLNPAVIGSYRGLCALMGFLATYLGSTLIAKLGTVKAGAVSLTCQAFLLMSAVLLYFIGPIEKEATLFIFLTLVILSRLGHWAYDMVIAQIFQIAIPQSLANIVSSAEMSLASFAELIMLAVAIVVNDVAHFGTLSFLSMSAVVCATCLYWAWLSKSSVQAQFKES